MHVGVHVFKFAPGIPPIVCASAAFSGRYPNDPQLDGEINYIIIFRQ